MLHHASQLLKASADLKTGQQVTIHDVELDPIDWTILSVSTRSGSWPNYQNRLVPVDLLDYRAFGKQHAILLTERQWLALPERSHSRGSQLQAMSRWFGFGYGTTLPLSPLEYKCTSMGMLSDVFDEDDNLEWVSDLLSYHILAVGEEYGVVVDVCLDMENGAIPFLIIDRGSWLKEDLLAIPTSLIGDVDTNLSAIEIVANSEILDRSPVINSQDLSDDRIRSLYEYYLGQKGLPTGRITLLAERHGQQPY